MVFRYRTRRVSSPLGECLVIEDSHTGKNVELLRVQAEDIIVRTEEGVDYGLFPQADYSINGDTVFISHHKDRSNHSIEINIADLKAIVRNAIGVLDINSYIDYTDINVKG